MAGKNLIAHLRAARVADVRLRPGEKIVVIPDVHHKWKRAEAIVSAEAPDRVVFLGDYFDDLDDTPEMARATARWLKRSMADGSRVHLLGNHDLSYMSGLESLRCSGYDGQKQEAIDECGVDWSRLEPFCWIDGGAWLCTHAGLSADFLDCIRPGATAADAGGVLEEAKTDLERASDGSHCHAFLQAGAARGGPADTGGIVWCDYDLEYNDVPGLRQIFGHTRGSQVRHKRGPGGAEHYCIDTVLHHYIAYKDGAVDIRPAPRGA